MKRAELAGLRAAPGIVQREPKRWKSPCMMVDAVMQGLYAFMKAVEIGRFEEGQQRRIGHTAAE